MYIRNIIIETILGVLITSVLSASSINDDFERRYPSIHSSFPMHWEDRGIHFNAAGELEDRGIHLRPGIKRKYVLNDLDRFKFNLYIFDYNKFNNNAFYNCFNKIKISNVSNNFSAPRKKRRRGIRIRIRF